MIITTGASGGLGLPLLQALARIDDVVATYNSTRPTLPTDSSIRLFQVDVSDESSVKKFADAVCPTASRITLLNFAGVSSSRLAVDLAVEEWDRVMNVNLKGSFLMSRAFLKTMIRQRWGRIINTSSIVAIEGIPGTAAYAAAKSGLDGLTRTLAKEYSRYGILVNTLVLGYFDGGMTNTFTDEQRKATIAKIPLRRLGDVADIAEAVRYLMQTNYVTGTQLRVDGGLP